MLCDYLVKHSGLFFFQNNESEVGRGWSSFLVDCLRHGKGMAGFKLEIYNFIFC